MALTQTTHFRLALASTQRWTPSALCRMDSLIPGSRVRYPFLSSRSPWQRLRIPPPLLLGLRGFLYRPYQCENNRNGSLLYPVRAPRFSLVRSAPHRLHCERLFVSAGCSTKEILKTFGSGYRYNVLPGSRVCDCLFLPLELGYFVISLCFFFCEDLRCRSGVEGGYWRRISSFPRHYLWDVANQCLVAFLLVSVLALPALVSPWPARLDIPRHHPSEQHWSLQSSVGLLPSPGYPCGLYGEGGCMSPPLNVFCIIS